MERRKKVARVVLSFVVVFIVCWLPRHIWYFWFNFDPAEYNMFWHVFKIVAYCLSFVNSCVNPLALYFLSRQFRRYYDQYLFCWCRRRHPADADPRGTALLAAGQQGARRIPDSTATSRPHERLQMTVVNVNSGTGGRRQHAAAEKNPHSPTKATMITTTNSAY